MPALTEHPPRGWPCALTATTFHRGPSEAAGASGSGAVEAPSLRFTVLGRLEALRESRVVTPTSHGIRAVLALLLVKHPAPVRLDDVYAELWGGRSPRSARTIVQVYISKLRQLLAPRLPAVHPGNPVETTVGGYRLRDLPIYLDMRAFTDQVDWGRRLAAHDIHAASEAFSQALRLWQDAALSDVDCGIVLGAYARRLNELRADTVEEYVDAKMRLNEWREAITLLNQALPEHPFRENFYTQLMTGLYATGRTTDALEVFRRARRLLIDEFGVEPGAAMTQAHQAILTEAPYTRCLQLCVLRHEGRLGAADTLRLPPVSEMTAAVEVGDER